MENNTGLLSALPNDALVHAISFLNFKDTLKLPELNSSFRRALSLSTLLDPTPLAFRSPLFGTRDEASNTPRRVIWIPVLLPHRTHSVVLTCQWRDQGYGNRKGALFVVAVPAEDDPNEETLESIENGKIVYQSPLAPHEQESLTISFSYSPSKAYYLWYRIGGGGGHQLLVNNLTMHTLIHDCTNSYIGQNYAVLNRQGFLQNHNDFSLRMLRLIAAVGQEEENTQETTRLITSFFIGTGFLPSEASIKALGELAVALLEQATQKEIHEPIVEDRRRVGSVPLDQLPDPDRNIPEINIIHGAMPMEVEQMLQQALAGDNVAHGAIHVGDVQDIPMVMQDIAEQVANFADGLQGEDGMFQVRVGGVDGVEEGGLAQADAAHANAAAALAAAFGMDQGVAHAAEHAEHADRDAVVAPRAVAAVSISRRSMQGNDGSDDDSDDSDDGSDGN